MEINNFLFYFYQEQQYIFAVCPCCLEVFQLSDTVISLPSKVIEIPELEEIEKFREKVESEDEKLFIAQEKWEERNEDYDYKKTMYELEEPDIIKKTHITGRKEANKMIKKFDSPSTFKNIDPHDISLIFYPIDYIVFPGMTEKKKFSNIFFYSKMPKNKKEEKVIRSIENSLTKGNIDFTIIRVDENGAVTYGK